MGVYVDSGKLKNLAKYPWLKEISFHKSATYHLFLDCVWQLLQQFPTSFEFSDTYLTTLYDVTHNCMFATFIFNSQGHRMSKTSDSYQPHKVALQEVWDWRKQFSEEHLTLFKNPLFTAREMLTRSLNVANGDTNELIDHEQKGIYSLLLCQRFPNDSDSGDIYSQRDSNILSPLTNVCDIKVWSLCYLRWLFPVQIVNGGTPSEYFQQCLLVEEITRLHQDIHHMKMLPQLELKKTSSDLIFSLDTPNVTQLIDSTVFTSSFPFSTAHNSAPFLATPLRAFIHQSSVLNNGRGSVRSSFKSYLEDSTEEAAEDVN